MQVVFEQYGVQVRNWIHLAALKGLKRNKELVISRPDKGNGVVVMDKQDYVRKMTCILSNEDKFQKLGCVKKNGNTVFEERVLQAFLLRHLKLVTLPERCMIGFDLRRPVDSACMVLQKPLSRVCP